MDTSTKRTQTEDWTDKGINPTESNAQQTPDSPSLHSVTECPSLSLHVWPMKTMQSLVLFVYLHFSSHSRIFHSFGGVTITDEGVQILTYARHSWSLSSEGSLVCHTYCDTGRPFMMLVSDNKWHLLLLPTVAVELSLPVTVLMI